MKAYRMRVSRLFIFCLFFCLPAVRPLSALDRPAPDAAAETAQEPVLGPADIPTAIVGTEVGDWAEYKLADGSTSRLTVVERWTEHGDDHLVIENAVTTGKGRRKTTEKEYEQVSVRERVADARDLGGNDFVAKTTMLVDGRRLNVVVVNYVEDGQVVRQSFFSDRVPVYGLVRGVLFDGTTKIVAVSLDRFGTVRDEE